MGTQTTWFHSITAIRYTKSFRVLSSRQISSNAPRRGTDSEATTPGMASSSQAAGSSDICWKGRRTDLSRLIPQPGNGRTPTTPCPPCACLGPNHRESPPRPAHQNEQRTERTCDSPRLRWLDRHRSPGPASSSPTPRRDPAQPGRSGSSGGNSPRRRACRTHPRPHRQRCRPGTPQGRGRGTPHTPPAHWARRTQGSSHRRGRGTASRCAWVCSAKIMPTVRPASGIGPGQPAPP
jgi:hypothetical protein